MNTFCRAVGSLAAAAGLAAVPAWSQPVDRFVDAELTTGSNNGQSWTNAYRPDSGQPTLADPLQRALTAAAQAGGRNNIYVANGTYKPVSPGQTQDRTVSFVVPEQTKVYGGYAGGENDLTQRNEFSNQCILDGDIGTTGVNTDNSYQ